MSWSVRYWKLSYTTSAMGPYTAPRFDTPDCSKSETSSMLQSPSPASLFDVSEGAYQFCTGIKPPSKRLEGELPPNALIAVWHIVQWPSPSTRYAPRFHSTDCVVSGWYSPGFMYSMRHPYSSERWLNGNRNSCARLD